MKEKVIRAKELVLGKNTKSNFTTRVPTVPTTYQEEFMNDDSDRRVFVGGRQVGKTTLMAWEALDASLRDGGTEVMVYCPTERASRGTADSVRNEIDRAGGDSAVGVVRNTRQTIEFDNGSRIRFESTSDGIPKYHSADLVLSDQTAYMNDDVTLSDIEGVAFPDGEVALFSTPQEDNGAFYEATQLPHYSTHHVKIEDSPYIASDAISQFSDSMNQEKFEQEIMGNFTGKSK